MSRNRCPLCGASHKSEAERCRLCGQSLTPGALAVSTKQVAQPIRAARGNKGLLLIGVGLVAAVLLGALVFGVVQANSQLRKAQDLVVGPADGWSTVVDEQGAFAVEMPEPRERRATELPVTDNGQVTGWEAVVGNDSDLLVAFGRVSPPLTDGTVTPGAARLYLRDTIVTRWATGKGLSETGYDVTETAAGGLPSVTVRTRTPNLRWKGADLYSQITFALNGNTLYVIASASIYRDAPQHDRMASSFRVTGTAT